MLYNKTKTYYKITGENNSITLYQDTYVTQFHLKNIKTNIYF